jgi:hypothetical protein
MTPQKSYPIGGTCSKGHPWETSAYIKKDGHRFCKVCCYEKKKEKWRQNMKQPDRALTPLERFHKRLDKTPGQGPEGTCWVWKGSRYVYGYGSLSVDGRLTRTHRIAWELANGPIPEGMKVLHKCDNPPCCNPEHLFIGTDADNVADKIEKGRGPDMKAVSLYRQNPAGERNGMAKLTDKEVLEIRAIFAYGVTTLQELADQFNSSVCNIARIVKRRTWRHI